MTRLSMRDRILLTPALPSTPKGYRILYDFLLELDDGRIQRTATTTLLAEAFTKVLKGADPLRALGLNRGRGQKVGAGSAGQEGRRHGAVWTFIADRLDASAPNSLRPARGALDAAIDAASGKFHKDRRTIQRSWAKFASSYQFMRRNRLIVKRMTASK